MIFIGGCQILRVAHSMLTVLIMFIQACCYINEEYEGDRLNSDCVIPVVIQSALPAIICP